LWKEDAVQFADLNDAGANAGSLTMQADVLISRSPIIASPPREEAMTTVIDLAPERLEMLRSGFSGTLLQPDDDGYDEARSIHNGLIDRRPALIARCGGVADVTDAIRFAREAGLDICVRGGGHNVTRVAETETAWPHRQEGFDLLITAEWLDPAATDENIAWTRSLYARLELHASGRRYVNYLDDDDADAVASAYGPNLARLAEVKRRYDPGNVFHHNHNILPAT
jgi:hypothetical protein